MTFYVLLAPSMSHCIYSYLCYVLYIYGDDCNAYNKWCRVKGDEFLLPTMSCVVPYPIHWADCVLCDML